jgi:hypothetical protein
VGTLVIATIAFYLGGVACALQWGFVLEDEDGEEIEDGAMLLRIRLALLWFVSYRRKSE